MDIGIGLPNPVPGTPGRLIPEWAARAEERGFAGLATIDRLAFPTLDSMLCLTAAAAVTERIGLLTNILLLPAYPAGWLAKATATLHSVSQGRFTLGFGVGGRPDDFEVADRSFADRGIATDAALDLMHRAWQGEAVAGSPEPISPVLGGGDRVPVLVGGSGRAAVRRTVRWGAGWTSGGAAPDRLEPMVQRLGAAWRDAGREGQPRIATLLYFSLGDEHTDDSLAYLRHYYAFLGDYAEVLAGGAIRTEAGVRAAVRAYEDVGVTELYLAPTVATIDQVDRLADLVH